jgi:general secretion pathway protein C
MDLLFKRYFWVLGILVVALCAGFAARSVNAVVAAKYLIESDEAKKRTATPEAETEARPDEAHKSKIGAPIADRNMFCSTCQPATPVAPTASGPSDPNNPPLTSLPLRLLATNIASNEKASFATVLNASTGRGGAYWIDQTIPGAGKVTRIRGKFRDFENESSHNVERIALGGEAAGAPAAEPLAAATEPPPPTESKDELVAAFDAGIKRVDDSNFDIDRALVDRVLANPMSVAKGARVVPSIKNGKPNGFKLYAIRPTSVYSKLGLMNGDTINSVNGFDLTTPDKALEVYTKVRESNNLSITVTRRGKSVSMNYNIK